MKPDITNPEGLSVSSRPGGLLSRCKRIFFYFLATILALAILEGFSRILTARTRNLELRLVLNGYDRLARGETTGFMPAPYVNYRLLPDYLKVERGRDFTTHNAQGFREPFPIGEKKAGILRIVCLGGSTTYGSGVKDNGQTYPAQLNRMLSHDAAYRIEGYRQCEVLNLGVGGYTSAEVLANLHFFALPLKPDVVLIQSAINDVAPRLYDRFDFSYEHFRKPMEPLHANWLARQFYRSRLVVLSGWLLGCFEPLTLQARTQLPLPPADRLEENFRRNGPEAYRRNIEAAIVLAGAAGCRVWLLTQAYFEPPDSIPMTEDERTLQGLFRRGLTEHNEILRELAATHSIGLIDLEQATPARQDFFTDPIHMTPVGNEFKARQVAEQLRTSFYRTGQAAP